jgi:2TM domain
VETLGKSSEAAVGTGASTVSERERARRRVQTKRDFASHVVAYAVINAFLVGIWAFTGAGYFWPAWVLGGWGAGLVLHAWDAFVRRPITEADIDAEIQRYHH